MDRQVLHNIGLTKGEVKVYLALLKIGEAKKSQIAKEAEVSSSKVYEICDRLHTKGLVGHIYRGKVRHFNAMEPQRILEFFNEKTVQMENHRIALQKMIPVLMHTAKKEETKAVLFEGFKAIKNVYKNILDELQPGEGYYVIGVNYGKNLPGVREFFENYHRQRAKRKIHVKMLVNHDARETLVKTIRQHSEIRYLPQYLISTMIILFYHNKAFIFFISKESIGLLIENKEITKGFKTYFDAFWTIASR